MPDGSVVALVSKQVTAYNAVNNSTVSRTSASKYGELMELSCGGGEAVVTTAVPLEGLGPLGWEMGVSQAG